MSDYANSDNGWLMQSAFRGAGVGTIAIALGLRKTLAPGRRVTASVVLLLIAGIGFLVAVSKTDPKGVTDLTTAGTLHAVDSAVIFFALLISARMVRGVFKRDPIWEPFAETQLWFAVAYTVAKFIVFGTPEDGPVGVTQRISVPVTMA